MDYVSKIQIPGGSTYNITGVIPMGTVASTSTSKVYTATISGITELKSGVCVWLTNGVVTSAANFTININGLGAKPVYRSNAATTRETTRFDKAYTIFLIYNETRVSGGCWDYVYGFDSNTTYTNMSQSEASAGTVTTGRVISAKVLSDTIEEHTAEINAVLPELVDDGAKNKLSIGAPTSVPTGLTCIRQGDGTYMVSGTLTAANSISFNIDAIEGDLVLSGCPEGGGNTTYLLRITKSGSQVANSVDTGSGSNVFTMSGTGYALNIRFAAGTYTDVIFKPMICSKAEWDISQEYVSYALPNAKLTAAAVETLNNGAKNEFCFDSIGGITNNGYVCYKQFSINGVTFTLNADNTVTATRTESSNYDSICILMYNGKPAYIDSFFDATHILSGCPAGGTPDTYSMAVSTRDTGPDSGVYELGDGTFLPSKRKPGWESAWNNMFVVIRYSSSYSGTKTYKPMICTFPQWNISREYRPYALPNLELTASAIEVIDKGPKNLLNHTVYTRTVNGVTYAVTDDRSIRIYSAGNNTQSLLYLVQNYTGVPAGNYVLSGCTGGSSTTYDLRVKVGASTFYINYDGGTDFYYNGTDSFEVSIVVRASQKVNITMKPMICTKADWDVSQEYQQYRPSYQTLCNTNKYITGTGTELASNANLNDYNYTCKMYSPSAAISATITNTPWTASGFQLITVQFITTPSYMQFLLPNTTTGKWYRRRYGSGTWSSWVEYDAASYLIIGATAIASSTDLNNLKTPGIYTCASTSVAGTLTHCPYKSSGFRCDVIQTSDTNCIRQIIQPNQMTTTGGNARYERSCVISSSTWSSWYKFEGTVVT